MKNEGQGRAWRFLPSIRLVGIDPFVFAENHAGVGKKWVYLNQLFSGLLLEIRRTIASLTPR